MLKGLDDFFAGRTRVVLDVVEGYSGDVVGDVESFLHGGWLRGVGWG